MDDLPRPARPAAALDQLLRGNQRFAAGQPRHPRQGPTHRLALAAGQQPLAAVLTCADSRVAPELVFDQGLGDLYVVRVAGNTATEAVVGGLEFAVEALGVPLVVVLSHDLCAAVAAAVRAAYPTASLPVAFPPSWQVGWLAGHAAAPGQLEAVVAAVRPALAGLDGTTADLLTAAIHANVGRAVERLRAAALIAPRLAAGSLGVVGAHYHLDSGRVALLTPAPADP